MTIDKEFFDKLNEKIDAIPTKEEAIKFIEEALEPLKEQALEMVNKIEPKVEEKLLVIKGYIDAVMPIVAIIKNLSVSLSIDSILALVKLAISQPLKPYAIKLKELEKEIEPPIKMYKDSVKALNDISSEINGLKQHLQQRITEGQWDVTVPEIPIPSMPSLSLVDTIEQSIKTAENALNSVIEADPENIQELIANLSNNT